MGRKLRFSLVAVFAFVVLAAAAGASLKSHKATTTLVFGASADPVILDGPLVSDGESLRPISLIFQGLVSLKPGTTTIEPQLATSWSTSKNGLNWTFNLRQGVKFTDGTPFNAAAVCFNFNRWWNFPGPLQNPSVTYYWNTVFGGFHNPAQGSPGPDKALYKGCKAVGQNTVIIQLTRKSGGFLGSLALSVFGMASPQALVKYKADAGTVTPDGVFQPTGTFGTQHPVGTGPYMFKSWTIGNKLVLVKNPTYWGKPTDPSWSRSATIDQLIFIPIADNAARLQALQTGEIQGYDNVAPQDIATVRGNSGLELVNRPPFNVGYVGINQSIAPMNNILVREAVAYGLDRAGVVNAFTTPARSRP